MLVPALPGYRDYMSKVLYRLVVTGQVAPVIQYT
jgi:hypothetical protein